MVQLDFIGGRPGNYVLGRGKLYAKGDLPAAPSRWRDLGNCTAFTLTQEAELKEHQSFLSGIKTIDLEVPVSSKVSLAFTIDEVANFLNLVHGLQGTAHGHAIKGDLADTPQNAAIPASDDSDTWGVGIGPFVAAQVNVVKAASAGDRIDYGTWIDLEMIFTGSSYPWRAYNFKTAQTFTVKRDTTIRDHTTGTAMVENVDYELDRKMGRIRILSTNTVSWNPASSKVTVHWTAMASPPTPAGGLLGQDSEMMVVKPQVSSGVTVALKFIQENPNDSTALPIEYEFFKVKITPDGEVSLIGDDWATLSFVGAASTITNYNILMASAYGKITGRSSDLNA